jgi:ABC-2 type transport system ATP-binding protein
VALADALVAKPPLLILDEPTAGLDPNQIRQVRELLEELGETHTILLSTHILSEVESTCQRALVVHHGKLVAEGPLAELKRHRPVVKFTLRDPKASATEVLEGHRGVSKIKVVEKRGDTLVLQVVLFEDADDRAVENLVKGLVEAGVFVREVIRQKAQLEDIFSELTRDTP